MASRVDNLKRELMGHQAELLTKYDQSLQPRLHHLEENQKSTERRLQRVESSNEAFRNELEALRAELGMVAKEKAPETSQRRRFDGKSIKPPFAFRHLVWCLAALSLMLCPHGWTQLKTFEADMPGSLVQHFPELSWYSFLARLSKQSNTETMPFKNFDLIETMDSGETFMFPPPLEQRSESKEPRFPLGNFSQTCSENPFNVLTGPLI